MNKQQTSNHVWIEIQYDADRDVMEHRVQQLNKLAKKCGMLAEGQEFYFFEHKGQTALGFIRGPSGEYDANTDWGRWFDLDAIADSNDD